MNELNELKKELRKSEDLNSRYHTDSLSAEQCISHLRETITHYSQRVNILERKAGKFTTRQLQIIAHSLALHENDEMFKGKIEGEMQDILSHLQNDGIWGYIDDVQGR